jgi:hypothetical protein
VNTPKIKIELNKGKKGVELDKLAAVAREASKFLTSLSVDLGEPETDWLADNFENGSVCFEIESKREIQTEPVVWKNAFRAVISNDFSDDFLNVRIRPETRAKYFEISKALPDGEFLSVGIAVNGTSENGFEWHRLDKSLANEAASSIEPKIKCHGEIQGIVHAFFKETKTPKLVVRELATRNLVDCYFGETMYENAVALLQDKNGVIFVEGTVSESPNGEIAEISVSDFTPAPEFDEANFESMIGRFPNALTGDQDAAQALDDFRS